MDNKLIDKINLPDLTMTGYSLERRIILRRMSAVTGCLIFIIIKYSIYIGLYDNKVCTNRNKHANTINYILPKNKHGNIRLWLV